MRTATSFDDVHELLRASLEEAVRDMFECYGHAISPASETEPLISAGASVAASIGYSHQTVSGSLTVIGSVGLVRGLLVETGLDLKSVSDLHDAGGEINNMLLGRVKNKCARYGLVLKLGTPTTVYGTDLRMMQSAAPSLTSTWAAFNTVGDRFYVRLDTLVANGYTRRVMCFKEDEAAGAVAEGETLFFDE